MVRTLTVSIPCGKGKEISARLTDDYLVMYPFPMGKVKMSLTLVHILFEQPVSIPYGKGKGKDDEPVNNNKIDISVSIPFGKGKGHIMQEFRISNICINSQWER